MDEGGGKKGGGKGKGGGGGKRGGKIKGGDISYNGATAPFLAGLLQKHKDKID